MNVRRSLVAVALLSTVVLTGCRGGADGANSEPDETATTTKPTPTTTPTPTPTATTTKPGAPKPKTLPTAGRSCTVLEEPLRLFPGHTLSVANRGTHLHEVQELQSMINGAEDGHHCIPEDGDFGPATRSAVEAFQTAYELTGYGVVGEDTWNQLNLVLSH
jgi:peptidoglycan hydrolase-like protein with peptidoglycan-binding domain